MQFEEEASRQGLDASLTHIVLPFAFENIYHFFLHVRHFRESLGSKAKGDEQYLPVLEALSDILESTALNFPALEKTLKEIGDEINLNAGIFILSLHFSQFGLMTSTFR